jgi:hypothetical protein
MPDETDEEFLDRMMKTLEGISGAGSEHDKKYDDFHKELGEFIAQFAGVETQLLAVLYHYGQLKWPIAKAIFSPVRVDSGITDLRRILYVRRLKTKRAKELTIILDHLNAINKLRNNILHLGFTDLTKPQPDEYWITNARLVYARRAAIRERISKRALEQLNWDLTDISLRLYCHLPYAMKSHQRRYLLAFRRSNPLGRPPAWRYKFPSPTKKHRKPRARSPSAQSGP